ncbi:hypothetical protein L1049_015725 [Liquidambar formosana]|uniref:Pentatricopeptide repeat-containing protein n=1 Tax=Liquidambar formosana TaxID=63359 RepID=A0AAP0S557_LIQFO
MGYEGGFKDWVGGGFVHCQMWVGGLGSWFSTSSCRRGVQSLPEKKTDEGERGPESDTRTERIDEAMELLKEMKEKGCKADFILGGLCREGRFEEALGMLERLPYEGVYLNKASYRIVLNFLCKEGEMEKATELLGLMLGRGFLPHFSTSNELLVRLCEAGKADDAATVLFGLVEMGFKPKTKLWALVVELICRERKILPAFELLDDLVLTGF